MASVTVPIPPPSEPGSQRFVLDGVAWGAYRQISEALTGRHLRITFDEGRLEFMTISGEHGNLCRLLARMVVVLTEELGLPLRSFGDMTCDRRSADKGLEPDECFYISNEPAIRDQVQIDLDRDPPPDLAIEIELSRPERHRLSVYAAVGIPEVWRFDGERLRIMRIEKSGSYQVAERSVYFPTIPTAGIVDFISRRTQVDENTLIREFRAWVGQRIQ